MKVPFQKNDLVQITGEPELFGKEFQFRMYIDSYFAREYHSDCLILDLEASIGASAGRYAASSNLRLSSKRKVLVEII